MAKRDALKVIDQGNTEGSGGSGTFVIADNVDRVDGFHAFPLPRPGALLALNAEGQFPASVFPGANVAAGQITGHHGVQFFGPTAYLAAALGINDTSILSTLPLFVQADDVLISRYDGYEWVSIADGGTVEGTYWRYAVLRGQQGTAVQTFPVYSEIVLAGHPGTGGHIFIDSGGSENSPYLRVRSSEADGTFKFRAQLGKLSTVPAGFRAKFPSFTAWATTWGLASENAFLSGGIHALYGDIAGNLDVSGTLTIQGPADSKMTLGETVGGWGLGVQNSAGRPVIQMLAPFVDANGNVISDVAFVLDNNGKPGIFYHQVEGTDDYRLEIGVDTLVGGNLRVGETFLVGTGEWDNTFAGIAIDSEWGLVGLAAGDTFPEDQNNGTYEVRWDKATGKLFTGGGAIGFGKQGMSLRSRDDPDLTSNIKWYDGPNKTMQFGSYGYQKGSWSVGSHVDGGYQPSMAITMDATSTGLQIWNVTPGTVNVYTAPSDGSHQFFVGGERVANIGPGGTWDLPLTFAGSEVTAYWTDSGRLGIGTNEPQALVDIAAVGTTPQLQLSYGSDLFTRFRVGADGTTWSTTGDIVLGPATNAIVPYVPYGVDLGSPFRKFGALYAAQLEVETLVAQTKIATIGGRVMVVPTTQLTFDVQTGDTIIFLKHNTPVVNDTLLLEGGGNLEAMTVTSVGALTPIGGYQYSVTRGVGTTDPQKWGAGAAVVITGQTGAGWIDQYASAGLARATTYGPTIVGNVRLSNTWNDWRERWGIGNLNGLYGYSATTWGVAFGNPLATHITIDDTNGYRLRNASTTVAQWSATGALTLGATGAITMTAAGAATFAGKVTVGTGNDIAILDPTDASYRLWIGNAVAASAPFSVTETGFVKATSGTIGGWTLAATQLTGGNAILNSTGFLTLGTTNDIVKLSAVDATYRLWIGNATAASAPFRVTKAGALTATNATITGAITANSGMISDWTINAAYLASATAGMAPADYPFYAGSAYAGRATAEFRVTAAGALTASGATITGTVTAAAGSIGGWTLGASTLTGGSAVLSDTGVITMGTGNNVAVMSAADATYRFWAGNAVAASAPFHVTETGYVKAISGMIGGFTLSSTALTAGAFVIDASGKALNGSGSVISFNTPNVVGITAATMNVAAALKHNGSQLSFFTTTLASRQTVSGSKGGNAALASLMTALANYGLVTDTTT